MVTEKDLDKLRTLQDILSQKIQLEEEKKDIPKQLSALEEAYNRTRKVFIDRNLEYEKVKSAEEDARNLLHEAEAAREKAERTISEINTQREYEALDKERQNAKEKEAQFRKEVQFREKNLLDLDEQIKQYAALIEQQEKELAEKKAGIEAEIIAKNKQTDALERKEKKLTDDLDKEVVFKFERIVRNKEGLGIVAIKGNVCMGCHMILPAQFSNNVHRGDQFVFCPYCSRILFYEEKGEDEEIFFDSADSGALLDPDESEDDEFEDDEKEEDTLILDNEE